MACVRGRYEAVPVCGGGLRGVCGWVWLVEGVGLFGSEGGALGDGCGEGSEIEVHRAAVGVRRAALGIHTQRVGIVGHGAIVLQQAPLRIGAVDKGARMDLMKGGGVGGVGGVGEHRERLGRLMQLIAANALVEQHIGRRSPHRKHQLQISERLLRPHGQPVSKSTTAGGGTAGGGTA
jgi:hypothetical protein